MFLKIFVCIIALTAIIAQEHHKHVYGGKEHRNQNKEAHEDVFSSQSFKEYHDGHVTKDVEYYGYPKYEFMYDVKDLHTHDFKYQEESRDRDVVNGVYSFRQPDGIIRIVKYYADKKSGFNADVEYESPTKHIVPEVHH